MPIRGNWFEPLLRWYLVIAVALLLSGQYWENDVLKMIAGLLLTPVLVTAIALMFYLLVFAQVERKPGAAKSLEESFKDSSPESS